MRSLLEVDKDRCKNWDHYLLLLDWNFGNVIAVARTLGEFHQYSNYSTDALHKRGEEA